MELNKVLWWGQCNLTSAISLSLSLSQNFNSSLLISLSCSLQKSGESHNHVIIWTFSKWQLRKTAVGNFDSLSLILRNECVPWSETNSALAATRRKKRTVQRQRVKWQHTKGNWYQELKWLLIMRHQLFRNIINVTVWLNNLYH